MAIEVAKVELKTVSDASGLAACIDRTASSEATTCGVAIRPAVTRTPNKLFKHPDP